MIDITQQTEAELRATIASAQQTIIVAEAELKERVDARTFKFTDLNHRLHYGIEQNEYGDFVFHDGPGFQNAYNIPKDNALKFWEWLGKRLGKQAPQEPCEISKVLELGPAFKPWIGRIYLGSWKGIPFFSDADDNGEIWVHHVGRCPFEECDNVREVKIKQ